MRLATLSAVAVAILAMAACGPGAPPQAAPAPAKKSALPPPVEVGPPLEPPAPGTPGGLPNDRTPVSEAPFSEKSAQGAANVVQTYYALIGEKKFAQARRLWDHGGENSGMAEAAFARSFDVYSEYRGNVGAPGDIEGAAGSLYIEIPVQPYGRLKSGQPEYRIGIARLRRINDVEGSTEEQRRWHIVAIELKPAA